MTPANRKKLQLIMQDILELPGDVPAEEVRRLSCRRWDSVAQVTLIAAIESEFALTLAGSDYRRMTSGRGIIALLTEKGL